MATPFAIPTALYILDHVARNMAGAVVMMPIVVQDASLGHARPRLAQLVVQLLVMTADAVPLLVVLHVMLKVHLVAAVRLTDSAAPLLITASSQMAAKMDALMALAQLQQPLLHPLVLHHLRHLKNQLLHLPHQHFQLPLQAVHLQQLMDPAVLATATQSVVTG
jgi:hypothetical protein